jgi:REP element-mobilizing transposase RayT
MTRLRRIEIADRFFFITSNLSPVTAALMPTERDFILSTLLNHRQRGDFFLFGFVLMPTHVHLLIAPHNQNLIRIMQDLKSKTGYEISRTRPVPKPIWQPGYFDTIVRRVRNFWQKLEYIHRNPVEAGLVKNPEDWFWSSYRHYIKKGEGLITLDPVEFPADEGHFLWPAPWR